MAELSSHTGWPDNSIPTQGYSGINDCGCAPAMQCLGTHAKATALAICVRHAEHLCGGLRMFSIIVNCKQ